MPVDYGLPVAHRWIRGVTRGGPTRTYVTKNVLARDNQRDLQQKQQNKTEALGLEEKRGELLPLSVRKGDAIRVLLDCHIQRTNAGIIVSSISSSNKRIRLSRAVTVRGEGASILFSGLADERGLNLLQIHENQKRATPRNSRDWSAVGRVAGKRFKARLSSVRDDSKGDRGDVGAPASWT